MFFLKLIHSRIYKKMEENIADTQFGFRKECETREALSVENVLMPWCLDVNPNIYVCFIDYNQAFDKMRQKELIEAMYTNNCQIVSKIKYVAQLPISTVQSSVLYVKASKEFKCMTT